MPRIPAEVDEPRRTVPLLASWPLSGRLPCPFLSLLWLFLSSPLRPPLLSFSFSFSFPFLFILLSRRLFPTTATATAFLAYSRRGEITSSCRSSHTFQGVPRARRGTLPSVSVPRRGTRVLHLIIRRRSAFGIAGESLIKGYVA